SDMRNVFVNELAIGADQTSKRNILIPDLDLIALSYELLDQVHHRTLAQIIRARFETEPQDTDAALADAEYGLGSAIDVLRVTREDRFQKRQFQAQLTNA